MNCVKAILKEKSETLPNEGIIKDCKEENGNFYYLVEIKEPGLILRNWFHESEIQIP